MSDLTNAAKLACTYIYFPINKAAFSKLYQAGETICGTAIVDGVFHICFQGTANLHGWIADFDVLPYRHPTFGNVHSGFYENLPAILKFLIPDIPAGFKIVVSGHSKGAGEGVLCAAELILAGFKEVSCILFACPNAGEKQFCSWVQKNIPGISFRNVFKKLKWFGDLVPVVPEYPYGPPYPHTFITRYPPGFLRFLPAHWHSSKLYYQGTLKFSAHPEK